MVEDLRGRVLVTAGLVWLVRVSLTWNGLEGKVIHHLLLLKQALGYQVWISRCISGHWSNVSDPALSLLIDLLCPSMIPPFGIHILTVRSFIRTYLNPYQTHRYQHVPSLQCSFSRSPTKSHQSRSSAHSRAGNTSGTTTLTACSRSSGPRSSPSRCRNKCQESREGGIGDVLNKWDKLSKGGQWRTEERRRVRVGFGRRILKLVDGAQTKNLGRRHRGKNGRRRKHGNRHKRYDQCHRLQVTT